MRRITQSILTIVASVALVSPLYAEGEFSSQAPGTTFYQNPELASGNTDEISQEVRTGLLSTESAENLLGLPVYAQDGENIGEVRDLKVDTRTGRIDYVLVEKEDIAVPVPLGALMFNGESARLTVDKSKLDNVPNRAAMSDQEFQRGLNTHYGVAPTWEIEQRPTIQEERKKLSP